MRAKLVGLLLAAGAGRRFDPSGHQNKLLVRLGGGKSVVATAAESLRSVLSSVVAVTRADHNEVGSILEQCGCHVVVCPDAELGMGAVLSYGMRVLMSGFPEADSCVLALGDMPFVQPATIARIVAELDGNDLVAPVFQGQRGHPVGFGKCHFAYLADLAGDAGARRLFDYEAPEWVALPVDDRGVIADIDLPADLVPGS